MPKVNRKVTNFCYFHLLGASNGSVVSASSTTALNTSAKSKPYNTSEECMKLLDVHGKMVRPTILVGINKFPLTTAEIDALCVEGNKIYKGFSAYKRCMGGLPRQALQILNHGIRKFIRSICSSPKKKADTVRDLKCATNQTLSGWTKCITTVDRQLRHVAANSTETGILGDLCCVYTEALDCIKLKTGTVDGCDKNANTTKFLFASINSVLKEVLDFVCGRYQYKEECVLNNPDGVRMLRAIAARNEPYVEGSSAFLISPILESITRFLQDDDEDGERGS